MSPYLRIEIASITPRRSGHPLGLGLAALVAGWLGLVVPVQAGLPNGVSSGDVAQTSAVLWTRSTLTGNLTFEYQESVNGTLRSVNVTVVDPTVPVKITVTDLLPGTAYDYRAVDSGGFSAGGRFRTPAPVGVKAGLHFGVTGDWRGELAPYPAVSNVPSAGLELLVKFGDTIYSDYPSPDLNQPQALTLSDYRIKHNEVYSTRYGLNTLADLQGVTPILSMIDDHEVINDFAGGAAPGSDPRFDNTGNFINETQLYGNGLQAFQEYNAVRDEYFGATADPRTAGKRKLYRARTFGGDAALFMLDARSFRDTELPPVVNPFDPLQIQAFLIGAFNPARTMVAQAQLQELFQDLTAAQAAQVTWKFVLVPEPIQNFGVLGASDRYEGYAAERSAILNFINTNQIRNVVFVTADIHGTLVNNLTYQAGPGQPQIPTKAFEISTGSVAFDAPFGPTVVDIARAAGLISNAQYAFYLSLPRASKDAFVANLVNAQLQPLGYDLVGLQGSPIDATLLQGSYTPTHTFGWTEFEIDQATQVLCVTTWGIDPYTEAELNGNPAAITARVPEIVSRFCVRPEAEPVPVALSGLSATTVDDGVVVRWTVGEARDHAGFHVYGQVGAGERVRLTESLLSGRTDYEYRVQHPVAGTNYWLAEQSRGGATTWHGPVVAATPAPVTASIALSASPSPFRASTTIRYSLPAAAPVRLNVFDAAGRRVANLVDGPLPAGAHEVNWDGRTADGVSAANGLYFLKLETGGAAVVRKVLFAR